MWPRGGARNGAESAPCGLFAFQAPAAPSTAWRASRERYGRLVMAGVHLLDVVGSTLAIGQPVVFAPTPPMPFSYTGPLRVGVIAALAPSIAIRSGGQRYVLSAHDAKRVYVIREREAEEWMRRQLAELGYED